jgi:hypothetical protein
MADPLGLAGIGPLSGEREHLFHKVWGLTIFTILPMDLRRKKLDILFQITYNIYIMYPFYEKEESFGRLIFNTSQTPPLHQEPTF